MWVDRLIYCDFPSWVFMIAYAVFGIILMTITIILAPRADPAVARGVGHAPLAVYELKNGAVGLRPART
jgi:hypothetical protein